MSNAITGIFPSRHFYKTLTQKQGEKDQTWRRLKQHEFEGQSTVEEKEKELQKSAQGSTDTSSEY